MVIASLIFCRLNETTVKLVPLDPKLVDLTTSRLKVNYWRAELVNVAKF